MPAVDVGKERWDGGRACAASSASCSGFKDPSAREDDRHTFHRRWDVVLVLQVIAIVVSDRPTMVCHVDRLIQNGWSTDSCVERGFPHRNSPIRKEPSSPFEPEIAALLKGTCNGAQPGDGPRPQPESQRVCQQQGLEDPKTQGRTTKQSFETDDNGRLFEMECITASWKGPVYQQSGTWSSLPLKKMLSRMLGKNGCFRMHTGQGPGLYHSVEFEESS